MNYEYTDGKIFINENDKEVAYVKYTIIEDNIWSIDSTFVDSSLRGQGIARKLIDELVALARRKNTKLKPVCSYAVRLFEDEVYEDVKYRK